MVTYHIRNIVMDLYIVGVGFFNEFLNWAHQGYMFYLLRSQQNGTR